LKLNFNFKHRQLAALEALHGLSAGGQTIMAAHEGKAPSPRRSSIKAAPALLQKELPLLLSTVLREHMDSLEVEVRELPPPQPPSTPDTCVTS
jgi:hypothetical protein